MTDTAITDRPTGAESVEWNLSHLYPEPADDAIEHDLTDAAALIAAFSEQYKGRIAELAAEEMAAMISEYELIGEQIGRAGSCASLWWAADTQDPARGALRQKVTERVSRLSQEMLFVDLEWAAAPDDVADALMNDPAVEAYRHYLEITRLQRPYMLSEPEERLLTEKRVTGRTAWTRLFSELHSAQRYEWNGEQIPQQQILNKLYEPDPEDRARAAESITEGLGETLRSSAYIFNTVLADKASDDRLRGYETWVSARNMSNQVDDETVEAMVEAITGRYDIVARYYDLKRRLLGLDELYDYDRYAPLPGEDRFYTWEEAERIILDAFAEFDPRMAEIAGYFFTEGWMDAAPRPGKRGGAFSSSAVPSVHPYILMQFEGTSVNVRTLAHELGHGVHQYLARERGYLQQGTPMTTAEMASVFAETLVFNAMFHSEEDPAVRLAMLTGRLEQSFATVFRQTAMNRFEDAIHNARREEGELAAERFHELWLQSQRDMFQGSVTMTENYGSWWSYIPHFVVYPGYVYAYAFGHLLVLAMYAEYQENPDGFADKYRAILAAGGSDWPHNIVAPLGIDLTDPNFWKKGLSILDTMVADAEVLADEIGAG